MNISDLFGDRPHRPEHPHFWRLSNILLKLDGRMDAASTQEEKDAVWDENLTQFVDEQSATYTALQRASRPFGVRTVADLRKHQHKIIVPMITWLEGFQIGAEFASRPLESETLNNLDETGLRLLLTNYENHVMQCEEDSTTPLTVAEFYETFER